MTIGEKIKVLRTSSQLSQESLATLLDVSRQSVSKWEQGISNPSSDNLMRLAEIFKVSVQDLMNDELQMKNFNRGHHYFSEVLKRKSIYLPICILLALFIITFVISVYLEFIHYDRSIIFILITMSGTFAFIAYLAFLSTILQYVYKDCKLRGIKPFLYVLISITILGFVIYLLRRDEITKDDGA
ncbi:MAG: helix-turn-helix transcriptional regulator [Coprobacillus sp.]